MKFTRVFFIFFLLMQIFFIPLGNILLKNQISPHYYPQTSNNGVNDSWTKRWSILGSDIATSVSIDSYDNIYVVGVTSHSFQMGYTPFLSKFNKSGDILWQKLLWSNQNNSIDTYYQKIKNDKDNNLFIGGFVFNKTDATQSIILSKYNSTGDLLWNKTLGKSYIAEINDMDIDSHGNIYIVGINLLFKINNSGSLIWNRTIEGVNTVSSMIENQVYVAGTLEYSEKGFLKLYNSSGFNIWNYSWDCVSVDKAITVDSEGSILIADGRVIKKLNSTGFPLWNCSLTSSPFSHQYIIVNSVNDVYVAASREIPCYDNSFFIGSFCICTGIYLSKLNSSGTLLWDRKLTGCSDVQCYDACIDLTGNVYITGALISEVGCDTAVWDAILMKNPKENVGQCIVIYYDLILLISIHTAIVVTIVLIWVLRKRKISKPT
jgi:hypothetical protein